MLSKIRTVLVHNSHPGNIGASARALKNMGLSQLFLVAPKEFPAKEAEARASNAQDILANTKVFATLEEALVGCTWVLGCSARQRRLSLPLYTAREAAEEIKQNLIGSLHNEFSGEIAILYGNEQHGLSNEELAMCAAQIVIPTAEEYASLNLAQAVQIISYELFLSLSQSQDNKDINVKNNKENLKLKENAKTKNSTISQTGFPDVNLHEMPNYESLAEFYRELEKMLINIQYLDPKNPGQMMVRLKHLYARAKLDKTELTLLRGMLTAIQNERK